MTHPDVGNQAFLTAAEKAWDIICEEEHAVRMTIECQVSVRFRGQLVFADPVTIEATIEAWSDGYYRALSAKTDTDYIFDLLGPPAPNNEEGFRQWIKHHVNVIERDRIKEAIDAKYAELALNS